MLEILPYNKEKHFNIWNDFNKNSKNGIFMFDRNFMDYHSDRFVDNSLMFYEDDKLIAILPASLHDSRLISHGGLTFGGFIVDSKMKQHRMNECFCALKEYLLENKKSLIYKAVPHIYHKMPAEEDLYSLFLNNARLIRRDSATTINLNKMPKMPKGRKAQISRARREGVVVEESLEFEEFIKLENEILKDRHGAKAVHTAEELKLLKSRFQKEIRLFVAKQGAKILAGTVIFEYPSIIHTQYMANSDEGCVIGALDLLIYELIQKYLENKEYFDFGISTENDGRFLNEGLISQKEGFGGRTIAYDFYEMGVL